MSYDGNFVIGMTFVTGILGIGTTFAIFVLKRIGQLSERISNLCERVAREETKSNIYHEPHDLDDK